MTDTYRFVCKNKVLHTVKSYKGQILHRGHLYELSGVPDYSGAE